MTEGSFKGLELAVARSGGTLRIRVEGEGGGEEGRVEAYLFEQGIQLGIDLCLGRGRLGSRRLIAGRLGIEVENFASHGIHRGKDTGQAVGLNLITGGLTEPGFGVDEAGEGGGSQAEGVEDLQGLFEVEVEGAKHGGAVKVGAEEADFVGEAEAVRRGLVFGGGGGGGATGIGTMDVAVFVAQGGAALALGEGRRGFGGHRVSFQ